MTAALLRFVTNPSNDYAGHSAQYLTLCAASFVAATVIGAVLGAVIVRRPVLAFLAVNLSGLMRAVPIIAFLALAIPYLGLGFTPAFVALTVLGVPPVLLNTFAGLRGVDPAVVDAARGMGMTGRQIALRIQAPLVLPVVASGARTAAVQIIATATLAAIIGAGGYGDYILSGLYQVDITQILAGTVPVSVLAILAEVGLGAAQRGLTPRGLRTWSLQRGMP
ncbi:MAG TPA: ABC transporter permease [bacterium]|nr:ABC transporter permease [bacterium]